MSDPVHSDASDAGDSRTRHFAAKRSLGATEGEDSSASTPSKRMRRSRRHRQNHRDFVPMGGSFANTGQIINVGSSDTDKSSDSLAISSHATETNLTSSIAMDGSTDGQNVATLNSQSKRPILGQNRLITGFAKTDIQPSSFVESGTSGVSRNDSASHNSLGESADDAIEISDDTDMEEDSEDGGMMINVDNDSDSGSPVPLFSGDIKTKTRRLRVTGWTNKNAVSASGRGQGESGNELHEDIKNLCKFLQRKAFPKQIKNMKFLNYERDGDNLIISTRAKDAPSYMNLNGCQYGGRTITVENIQDMPSTQQRTDLSDGEVEEVPLVVDQGFRDDAHEQLQGDLNRSLSSKTSKPHFTDPGHSPQRLGDLSSADYEKQVKYTLFHLQRDQIDINRFAICTTCLQEGHQETSCPESNCLHCGVKDEHPSRNCPKHRRCLKCRERGHDVDTCASRLKNNTVPCDNCGSEAHLEDNCQFRFFPSQPQTSTANLKLWISCCICASKTHFVGDCPERDPSSQTAAWSLRSLDPMQISNLSLESGTRKLERDTGIRGTGQAGLHIKGRADVSGNQGPPIRTPLGRQEVFPIRGGKNRFADRDSERNRRTAADRRRDGRDDFYRPSDPHPQEGRYDRYEASYTADYRDQPKDRRGGDAFYATDSFGRRRRSRSPEFRNFRGGPQQKQQHFQPPLPKAPPPNRPQPSASSAGLPHRRRTTDKGPPGVDRYMPMPSAAKQAWDKHRL